MLTVYCIYVTTGETIECVDTFLNRKEAEATLEICNNIFDEAEIVEEVRFYCY